MAYDILVPLLYSVQHTMEMADSQVKFLYTSDTETNSTVHVNMTSWMLYSSKNVYLLLNFLSVDKEMQSRLLKRMETTRQKMMRWLWNREEGYFDDISKNGDDFEHSNHLSFDSMLPFVLDIGQIGNVKYEHYLSMLFDSAHVMCLLGL